jgi:hypothetical protein
MKDHLVRTPYCRWCPLDDLTPADLATSYPYTVDWRPDGEPIRGTMRLCQRHARQLDFIRHLVVIGKCTDWAEGVCHDMKALGQPLRDH